MAFPIPTGRERTLTYTFGCTAPLYARWYQSILRTKESFVRINLPGAQIEVETEAGAAASVNPVAFEWSISGLTGLPSTGGNGTRNVLGVGGFVPGGTGDCPAGPGCPYTEAAEQDWGFSGTLTCTIAEYWTPLLLPAADVVGGGGADAEYPVYPGPDSDEPHIDAPFGRRTRRIWYLKPGSDFTLAVTTNQELDTNGDGTPDTDTFGDTVTIPGSPLIEVGTGISIDGRTRSLYAGSSTQISGTFPNGETFGIDLSGSHSGGSADLNGPCSVTVDGVTCTEGSFLITGSQTQHYTGRLNVSTWREGAPGVMSGALSEYPGTVQFRANLYNGLRSGVSGLNVLMNAPDGQATWSEQQRNRFGEYAVGSGSTIIGTAQKVYDELIEPRVWLDRDWLASVGEETDDWRCLLHGYQWPAMEVSQAATVTVDDGSSLTPATGMPGEWTAGANTTLAVDAGIEATVSGGAGSLTRSFDSVSGWVGRSFGGYRYLKVRAKADADDRPFKVTIGEKWWDVDRDGNPLAADIAAADFWLDLCSPSSAGLEVDEKQTEWPWLALSPREVEDSSYWGVTNVESLTIGELEDGGVYTFEALTLSRADFSTLTFIPSYGAFRERVQGGEGDPTVDVRRGILGDTDGRWSADIAGLSHVTGAFTDLYLAETIEGVGIYITYLQDAGQGWGATPDAGLDEDEYRNRTLEWVHLWGAGLLWDGSAWTPGVDRDASTALPVKAQELWDWADFPADSGDIFLLDGGAWGSTDLAWGKILRAQCAGLVLTDDTGAGREGASVTLTDEISSGHAGSGTSDSRGRYLTGGPYARGGREHRAECTDGGHPTSQIDPAWARFRHRRCFRVTTPAEGAGIAYDVSDGNRQARAYVGEGGTLWVEFAQDAEGVSWSGADIGIEGERPWLEWQRGETGQRLNLFFVHDGDVKRAVSEFGGAFGMPETVVEDGTHPAACVTPDNILWLFWIEGEAIKFRRYDPEWNLLTDTVTVVASGVSEECLAPRCVVLGAGTVRVNLFYRTEGGIQRVSSVNGGAFS